MVAETETVSRDMLAFLECDWNAEVLDFHKNPRICATSSYAQVRQPIYSSSVGRAERYRHRLGELVALAQLSQ